MFVAVRIIFHSADNSRERLGAVTKAGISFTFLATVKASRTILQQNLLEKEQELLTETSVTGSRSHTHGTSLCF